MSADPQLLVEPEVRRSRRAMWWMVSIGVHLALAAALAFSPTFRNWLFGVGGERVEVDADQAAIDRARRQLIELYSKRLRDAIAHMRAVRDGIDERQLKRLGILQEEDAHLVDAVPAPPVAGLPPLPEDDEQDIPALYARARAEEEWVLRTYERLRAFDLCALQQIPLHKALEVTRLVLPTRAELDDRTFSRVITTVLDGWFNRYKLQLQTTHQEVQAMVAHCDKMLTLAMSLMGEEVMAGVRAWDLTGVQLEALERHDHGAPYVGAILMPHEKFMGGGDIMTAEPVLASDLGEPGRIGGTWMAVDTWYIIGPFTHPGRARPGDLDRQYPPESRIDLDGIYVGKQGRPLHWKFKQSPNVRIQPDGVDNDTYAVWYAYTEIWSDRDQELYVSFGSDDYSVCWVEGEQVWVSGKTPQPWAAFGPDAFRKVRFKRGHNRVLFKLENAGGTTGLSMVVCLDREAR